MGETRILPVGLRAGAAGLEERVAAELARVPNPERAVGLARDVLEASAAVSGERLRELSAASPEALARAVAAVCGHAPFLAPRFLRRPEWLARIAGQDLRRPRGAEDYRAGLEAAFREAPDADPGALLRRFKYFELARITARECTPELVPEEREGEVLAELSALADTLLSRALQCAAERTAERLGPPEWSLAEEPERGPQRLEMTVLALGKLGSSELNYSSDVDLVYVFESPPGPPADGPQALAPPEYFARLARELGRLVAEVTPEGFLYRVDLDLRPDAVQGALALSSDAFTHYHEVYAAAWEKAAFMKARPVAGDLELGWRVIRSVHPMIYRSAMDYAGVVGIRQLKERIEEERRGREDAFDVKIGAGGIRDVEFVAQALQLLYGGRIPQVRVRGTQAALGALADAGLIESDEVEGLLRAYRFLRRVEHRLQMQAERQVHRVPEEPDARRRVARAMGFGTAAGAGAATSGVAAGGAGVETSGAASGGAGTGGGDPLPVFDHTLEAHRQAVRRQFGGLFEGAGSGRILALFERHAPRLLESPGMRRLAEELAASFAREIDASPDPERAMNNLVRFVEGVGARTFYFGLLADRPELIPRLAALFAGSNYLSAFLAAHPRLIEPVFGDPNVLLLSREELERDFEEIRAEAERETHLEGAELELDALRLFANREILNVGLLDIGGKVAIEDAEDALTEIAEVCIGRGLSLARAQLGAQRPQLAEAADTGRFLVVGMGKLATRELSYGADLDVIFLYEPPPQTAEDDLWHYQEAFARLAQKLIWALETRTAAGSGYAIDARLRPSGGQGTLVTSLGSFERYHESAAVWERQALLRARPVAGDPKLAEEFEAVRRGALTRPLPPDAEAEIHRIRLRMERELAHETPSHRDFKTGRGGLLDVESVVQLLQLQHGAEYPGLLAVEPVHAQLVRLEGLGLLDPDDARVLREGAEFFRRLASRLRVVANRSISDLDVERADLDALAQAVGYPRGSRPGTARRALLTTYDHHTTAVRAVYRKVLGVEAEEHARNA